MMMFDIFNSFYPIDTYKDNIINTRKEKEQKASSIITQFFRESMQKNNENFEIAKEMTTDDMNDLLHDLKQQLRDAENGKDAPLLNAHYCTVEQTVQYYCSLLWRKTNHSTGTEREYLRKIWCTFYNYKHILDLIHNRVCWKLNQKKDTLSHGWTVSRFLKSYQGKLQLQHLFEPMLAEKTCCSTLNYDLRVNHPLVVALNEELLLYITHTGSVLCMFNQTGTSVEVMNIYPSRDVMYGKDCYERRRFTPRNVIVLRHHGDIWMILSTNCKHQLYKVVQYTNTSIHLQKSKITHKQKLLFSEKRIQYRHYCEHIKRLSLDIELSSNDTIHVSVPIEFGKSGIQLDFESISVDAMMNEKSKQRLIDYIPQPHKTSFQKDLKGWTDIKIIEQHGKFILYFSGKETLVDINGYTVNITEFKVNIECEKSYLEECNTLLFSNLNKQLYTITHENLYRIILDPNDSCNYLSVLFSDTGAPYHVKFNKGCIFWKMKNYDTFLGYYDGYIYSKLLLTSNKSLHFRQKFNTYNDYTGYGCYELVNAISNVIQCEKIICTANIHTIDVRLTEKELHIGKTIVISGFVYCVQVVTNDTYIVVLTHDNSKYELCCFEMSEEGDVLNTFHRISLAYDFTQDDSSWSIRCSIALCGNIIHYVNNFTGLHSEYDLSMLGKNTSVTDAFVCGTDIHRTEPWHRQPTSTELCDDTIKNTQKRCYALPKCPRCEKIEKLCKTNNIPSLFKKDEERKCCCGGGPIYCNRCKADFKYNTPNGCTPENYVLVTDAYYHEINAKHGNVPLHIEHIEQNTQTMKKRKRK